MDGLFSVAGPVPKEVKVKEDDKMIEGVDIEEPAVSAEPCVQAVVELRKQQRQYTLYTRSITMIFKSS